jgi:hypothetical protein
MFPSEQAYSRLQRRVDRLSFPHRGDRHFRARHRHRAVVPADRGRPPVSRAVSLLRDALRKPIPPPGRAVSRTSYRVISLPNPSATASAYSRKMLFMGTPFTSRAFVIAELDALIDEAVVLVVRFEKDDGAVDEPVGGEVAGKDVRVVATWTEPLFGPYSTGAVWWHWQARWQSPRRRPIRPGASAPTAWRTAAASGRRPSSSDAR